MSRFPELFEEAIEARRHRGAASRRSRHIAPIVGRQALRAEARIT